MELAKVTSKGQVTIPIAIRNMLGIREGDKILFIAVYYFRYILCYTIY